MRGLLHRLWPQLELFAPAERDARGRWEFTRAWAGSPHIRRARRELDAVRDHFPELDDVTVRVGLTKRRNVLGLASLGATPMIWIRPRRIHRSRHSGPPAGAGRVCPCIGPCRIGPFRIGPCRIG